MKVARTRVMSAEIQRVCSPEPSDLRFELVVGLVVVLISYTLIIAIIIYRKGRRY